MPSSGAFLLPPHLPLRLPKSPSSCKRRWRAKAVLPSSVASVTDPRSGARIHIVGCVHGSQVSADDVQKLLDQTNPDIVVVELCQARLNSLRKDLYPKKQPSRPRSFDQIRNTFGGTGPAIVAVALELVYNLQRATGVKPGLEFFYPIRNTHRWSLVCGDAPARDTVQHLYNVFRTPFQSIRQIRECIDSILMRLVFPPSKGVNIPHVLFTDPTRLSELVKLTLPAVALSSFVGLAGSVGTSALELGIGNAGDAVGWDIAGSVTQMMLVSYIIVSTLRFVKVLIADRDRVLADNILHACTPGSTVCAVVGLLHVNGMVDYIEDSSRTTKTNV